MVQDILYIIIQVRALRLAPGQAFMVASDDTSSDNVSFTTAMRTAVGGDDLIVGDVIRRFF